MKALSKVRIVAAAFVLAASISQAGTITVTDNLSYPDMSDTTCTLSQAIAAANLANGVTPDSVGSATTDVGFNYSGPLAAHKLGNCAGATSGANSIVFAPALAGATLTYTTADFSTTPWNADTGGVSSVNGMAYGHGVDPNNLADNYWYGLNALPPIASEIRIDGGTAGVTLKITIPSLPPTARLRFFYVSGGLTGELPAGSLSLHNMTLTGGVARGGIGTAGGAGVGGAIFNQGILNLTAVTLTSNSAIGGDSKSIGNGGGGMSDRSTIGGGGMGGGPLGNFTYGVNPLGVAPLGGAYGGQGGAQGGNAGAGGGGFTTGSDGGTASAGVPGIGGGLGGLGGCSAGATGCYGDGGGGGGGNLGNNAGGSFGQGSLNPGSSASGGGVGGGGGGAGNGGFGGGGGGFGNGGFGGGGVLGGFGGADGVSGATATTAGAGAGMGGAIFNHRGSLNLTNVTMSGNSASGGTFVGSPPYGSGLGAAIFNLNGTVTIAYSTLANNAVNSSKGGALGGGPGDGAVYSVAYGNKIEDGTSSLAALTITDSIITGTVASNGAGNNDVVNNVVAGTHPANTGNTATLTYTGKNIIGASQNATSSAGATATQNGAPTSSADPKLGALFNYTGPTQTMRPLPGSPAINAVSCTNAPPTDQRGVTRPQPSGGNCDLGSVELTVVELDRIFADNFDGTPTL
ncbi:MAG: hypothetical protein KGK05_02150 [Xanthomonadaceae bacterium]|nr:hypothetical protein [Xanthomonadaceae bacterium]